MSHSKQRSEKVCLNCGAQLYDRYCHKCGQENVEPKQSLWHLIVHFFNDVTHFDGKFFSTMKLLLAKPGFLSKEWVAGRRASYLDPVRMYIFISTVFFIVMLWVLPKPHFEDPTDEAFLSTIDSVRKAEYDDNITLVNDDVAGREVFVLNVFEDMRYGYKHYDSANKAKAYKPGLLENYLAKRAIATYEVYEQDPINFSAKF